MSDIVTIGAVTTPVVSYKNQRVCTSKRLRSFTDALRKILNVNFDNTQPLRGRKALRQAAR